MSTRTRVVGTGKQPFTCPSNASTPTKKGGRGAGLFDRSSASKQASEPDNSQQTSEKASGQANRQASSKR